MLDVGVPPEAKAHLEDLAQYVLPNPFSVEKMTLESPGDMVIYRSRLNANINRNFEVYTAADFLAAITQHIPDKGAQEKTLRHLGAWQDPPAKTPSPRAETAQEKSKNSKNSRLTFQHPSVNIAPCLVRPKNQFSLTRVVLSTCGHSKNPIPVSWPAS
jgi:hypothetical protein